MSITWSLNLKTSFYHVEPYLIIHIFLLQGHGWCTKGKYCPKSHDIDLIIDIDEFCKDRKSRKRKRRKQNQQGNDSQSYNDSADMDLTEGNSDSTEMSVGDAAQESDCKDIENKTDRMEIDGRHVNKTETIINGAKLDQRDLQREKENDYKCCENCGRAGDAVLSAGGHRAGYDAFMTGLIYGVYQTTLTGDERERKIGEWKNKLYLSAKDYPLTVSKSNFVKQSKEHLEKLARIRRSNTVQAFS